MALPAQQEEITLVSDSLGITDSIAAVSGAGRDDNVRIAGNKGIIMQRPSGDESASLHNSADNRVSWMLTGLFLVFVVVCLRYRKNSRYFSILFRDVMEIRERHNAFDDTLRETSFLWLLNILWCGSAGILLYGVLYPPVAGTMFASLNLMRLLVCMGIATAYTVFMAVSYTVVGSLFANSAKASVWLKGYLSTQGLEAMIMFMVALIALCVPGISTTMLIVAAIIFIIAKILFIYKGFCIFFAEFASWVLFLYYLCSLEIVPIVLAYAGARFFCGMV